jgi:hypothetical protein
LVDRHHSAGSSGLGLIARRGALVGRSPGRGVVAPRPVAARAMVGRTSPTLTAFQNRLLARATAPTFHIGTLLLPGT